MLLQVGDNRGFWALVGVCGGGGGICYIFLVHGMVYGVW